MTYWFTLVNFSVKLPVLVIDFLNIAVSFMYLRTFQHWSLNKEGENLRVVAGEETTMMLKEYMNLKGIQSQNSHVEESIGRKSVNDSQVVSSSNLSSSNRLYKDKKTLEIVENLKNATTIHQYYKSL